MGAEEDKEVSHRALSPPPTTCCCQAGGVWRGASLGGVGQKKGAPACIKLCTCRSLEALRADSAVHFQSLHTQSCVCRMFGLQKTDREIGIQIKGAWILLTGTYSLASFRGSFRVCTHLNTRNNKGCIVLS